MSQVSASQNTSQSDQVSDEVIVRHWPLLQSGWKGVAFMLLLLGVFLAVQVRVRQTGMAALSILAVLSVTVWYWLPVRYVFRPAGIERRLLGTRRLIPWSSIGGYKALPDGIQLFVARGSNSAQGLFVSWNGKQELLQRAVDQYIQQSSRRIPGSSVISSRSHHAHRD
jgi:hypothetical protein